MLLNPALQHVLAPRLPQVRLLGTAESTSDLTTYTFSGMDIGGFGGSAYAPSVENIVTGTPLVVARNRKVIFAIVHGEDTQATFNVSSVTIGGISGTERVDSAGASAANAAIYQWTEQDLIGIANTDVVVTWSEAITGCAVAIVEVSGLRAFGPIGTGIASGTGIITLSSSGIAADECLLSGAVLVGTTCTVQTETPSFSFEPSTTQWSGHFAPLVLYEQSNAEFAYSAAFYPRLSAPCDTGALTQSVTISWSGTGNGDAAALFLA